MFTKCPDRALTVFLLSQPGYVKAECLWLWPCPSHRQQGRLWGLVLGQKFLTAQLSISLCEDTGLSLWHHTQQML